MFSASFGFAAVGAAIAWPSPILPKIIKGEAHVHMSSSEISWMVSLMYLGNLVMPIPAGYLANWYGRKKTLLYFGVVPIISWLLILFSKNFITLYIARFIAGLHFGLISTIHPIYIGEISQPDIRGTLSTINAFALSSGSLFIFVIGPFVSFKVLALVTLLIPVSFILCFFYMPESPYYCLMQGDTKQARESLFWLRGDLNRIELESELQQIERMVQTQMQKQGTFKDIFLTKASRKAIAISLIFSIVKRFSGNGVIQAFATVTLPEKTFGVLDPNSCVLIMGIVTVLSSFLAAYIADRFGRRELMVVSCAGCSLSMLAVAFWFFLNSKTNLEVTSTNFVPFVGFLIQNISFCIACGPIGGTVKGELFPPNVKTKSSALATITLAISGFFTNKFYLVISEWEGMYLNYFIFALACFLGVLFTICYVPETKGKTLQEIQDTLNGAERRRVANATPE